MKVTLRSRLSRFYWKHDWFRRTVNIFALPQNLLAIAGAVAVGAYVGWGLRGASDSEQLDSYAKNYFESSDRASACNETLRLRIQEHNGCEAALRKCREK